MKTPDFNPAIDVYINKTQPFAQPILTHLRELVHKACPDVQEAIKWSMPFFVLDGVILANMAAFKQHCRVDLWGPEIGAILVADGFKSEESMGAFGRLTNLTDLPSDKILLGYLRQAAQFIASGQRTKSFSRPPKAARPAPEIPAELTAALKTYKASAKIFANFSPSCRREYVDWIAEAKRPETRQKRAAQAAAWISEGKARHWKHQSRA